MSRAALARLRQSRIRGLIVVSACVGVATFLVVSSLALPAATVASAPERHPQTTWTACNRDARSGRPSTFTPLSDARAAFLVTPQAEDRPDNARSFTVNGRRFAAANSYRPTGAQLRSFRRARTSAGQPVLKFNPYFRYVDGLDGLRHPSTDDLIQWAAHKWGIPENWLRAEFLQESYWNQFQLGDSGPVSARWYRLYPPQARIPRSRSVHQSLGITQVKWIPDGSVGAGTEPLRWQSTAFNLDYQAATIRLYYDNPEGARSSWGDRTYVPCERWNSLGGWYEPYPWGNGGQETYITSVRRHLKRRDWTDATFVHWLPSSLPPGVSVK